MEYKQEIVDRIMNSDKWPGFERPDFLDDLNKIADDSYSKGTFEGYLSALLIYQQLTEETIKLYLKDHEFYIQLSVFPAEINFSEKSKTMFGRLIEELSKTISVDESKDEIIKLANELNQIRIDLVHGLTKLSDLTLIEIKVTKARDTFDKLFELFDEAHDMFRVCFKDFKKHKDLGEYIEG